MLERLLDPPPETPRSLVSVLDFSVAVGHPSTRVTVLDPCGELDLCTSPAWERYLSDQLRDRWCTQLILDLSHLRFCGAAGLRGLLAAQDVARAQHICLYLVSGRVVTRLFSLSGLDEQFLTYPDLTAALATASAAVRTAATHNPAPDPAAAPRCPVDAVPARPQVL